MTGDFTRTSFRPARRYSTVRMQQGRVLLDADWNEHADIARWRERLTNGDVIGPCGFPEDAPGFALLTVPGDLGITPGRGYVAGRLIENPEPAPVRLERLSGSGAGTRYRVTAGPALRVGQPVAPPSGDLTAAVAVTEVDLDADGRQEVKLSAGIGAGAVKPRTAGASIGAQPYLIAPALPEAAGDYLAYLEVWERPIGALEDPLLREVALGGPDSCQREQMIWQVKLLSLDGFQPAPPDCKSFGPDWRPEGDVAPATLAARAEAASADEDPCALPAAGGYRSLENHLYRVEIHNGGTLGADSVTWKWSRDNAMHRARLLEVSDGALVVDSPGLDDATAYRSNEWLEVLDEARVLAGRPGFFVQIGEVNGNRLGIAKLLDPDTLAVLTDGGDPDTAVLPGEGLVRRWEGGPPVALAADAWTPLENGVEVRAGAGFVRGGDFWTIPARSVTADVEWPRDPSSGAPAARAPEGVARHYCALAVVARDSAGNWSVTHDCRHLFPPLTALETFDYLGGDGQEVMPDLTAPGTRVALHAPLRVGVARGETPVAGRLVRFSVEENGNNAALGAPPGADVVSATTRVLIVRSGADGVAAAELALHPRRHVHRVTAELLDCAVPAQADRAHLPIHFTATLSTADEVAYDPATCEYQQEHEHTGGASRTVQEALDKLCPRPVLRALGGDGQLLCVKSDAPQPLRVGVSWGRAPLQDVKVAFEVVAGNAVVVPDVVATAGDGIAEVALRGGDDPLLDGGAVRVTAKALDLPVPAHPEALVFHARYANAQCVYVDEDVCPAAQEGSGERTVAAMLRFLCEQGGGAQKSIHVVNIGLAKARDGSKTLHANAAVTPQELASGVVTEFDGPLDPGILEGSAVGKIVLDLPSPAVDTPCERFYGVNAPLPFRTPFELVAGFQVDAATGRLLWQPGANSSARRWLEFDAPAFLKRINEAFGIGAVNARLVLHGNRIWGEAGPDLPLDGDLFLDPRETAGVRYPSGDGVRGGDLVLPFRLVSG